jgi:hypothetical protein
LMIKPQTWGDLLNLHGISPTDFLIIGGVA